MPDSRRADGRPDPEELLDRVVEQEARARRGKLKVYLGAAPGVGKTTAMLRGARRLLSTGVDVLVGIVETHQRFDTESLLLGFPRLERVTREYRGRPLEEFDLEGALARKPRLLLLDELAHTNVEGGRNAKRWQDVLALLEAGIDVHTTLNIQHVDSLNDVVAQVTGVRVRETVPDSVLERADEIELVDLPPAALLERLQEGKVYLPEQAGLAAEHFFSEANLTALRELALRKAAEWVDARVRELRLEGGAADIWPTSERMVAVVEARADASSVVRAAQRIAQRARAEWIALYVEGLRARPNEREGAAASNALRLAESLGAEAVTLSGWNEPDEVVAFARRRNANRIVLAAGRGPAWLRPWWPSLGHQVLARARDIEITFVPPLAQPEADEDEPEQERAERVRRRWHGAAAALLAMLACSGIGALGFRSLDIANIAMIYLLGIVLVAARWGGTAGVIASVLGVASLDFFFVPPNLTFAVSDGQYLIMFAVMLSVSLLTSRLTARIREQALAAEEREQRTASLYSLSRELASAHGLGEIAGVGRRHMSETFAGAIEVLLLEPEGALVRAPGGGAGASLGENDLAVARLCVQQSRATGRGTGTLPSADVLCQPLLVSQRCLGAVVLRPAARAAPTPARLHLLETFARLLALALERHWLHEEGQRARLNAESERMRNALLSSVSHDLRTPLATITGAASAIESAGDPATRAALLRSISEEAGRLNRLIQDLIQATRLEAGQVELRRDWVSLEEVVGAARAQLRQRLAGRALAVHVPAELPLVKGDPILLQQLLVNLLDNALQHGPPDGRVSLAAWSGEQSLFVEVSDEGPGFAAEQLSTPFERHARGAVASAGLGLGLYICRGIVEAHGGRIQVANRPEGGASVRFSLPLPSDAPAASALPSAH